jgi:hypothetical protein
VYQERRPTSGWDILTLALDGEGRAVGAATPLLETPANEMRGVLSPDGRLVAYESDELDALVQVYVATFPDLAQRAKVSAGGGREPVWSSDGRLFFWDTEGQQLVEARLHRDPAAGVEVLERAPLLVSGETLWRTDLAGVGASPGFAGYQVSSDGGRFLLLEPYPLPEFHEHGIVVLVNWLER